MKRKIEPSFVIMVIAVLLSVVFIVILARENNKLKRSLTRRAEAAASGRGTGEISGPPELIPGDQLTPFVGRDLDGKPQAIAYDGSSKYFFYIFSPSCHTCQSQFPIWNGLLPKAKQGKYSVIGFSLDPPGERAGMLAGLRENSVMMMMPSLAIQRTFRVIGIPMVVVASADGKVEWLYYGPMPEGKQKELAAKLSTP